MTALVLRLHVGASVTRIRAIGALHSGNAHQLPEVVIGCLQRFSKPVLELDLSDLLGMDPAGINAIHVCQRCAERRGVRFTLAGVPAGIYELLEQAGARPLVPQRPPPRQPQTGTICRDSRF